MKTWQGSPPPASDIVIGLNLQQRALATSGKQCCDGFLMIFLFHDNNTICILGKEAKASIYGGAGQCPQILSAPYLKGGSDGGLQEMVGAFPVESPSKVALCFLHLPSLDLKEEAAL